MRFLSIYTHEHSPHGPTPEMMAKMGALIEEGMKAGWLIATEGVQSGRDGFLVTSKMGEVTVTDGPFSEAKEVIGGYAILEAPSREAVIAPPDVSWRSPAATPPARFTGSTRRRPPSRVRGRAGPTGCARARRGRSPASARARR